MFQGLLIVAVLCILSDLSMCLAPDSDAHRQILMPELSLLL